MHIVVCIKQVPDPSQARIDRETGLVIREGVDKIINPYDLYALEESLRLKEAHDGQVTALSMGPPSAEDVLKDAVAMGVDHGVLLSGRDFAGADTLATSYALALAVQKLESVDLIICGKQAADGDTAQVGPGLAANLDRPHVTEVRKIRHIEEDKMVVERLTDTGYEVIRLSLPAVITVVKEINEPRIPGLRGMMRAKKAQIPAWDAEYIGADPQRLGLKGSPTRVWRTFEPTRHGQGEMLRGTAGEQAVLLWEKLRGRL
ncbi:MAG: electron transfer flavoprotein subunit beta/FixA family protein [Firmicutes bacterium]|nr:electron transfer flavoprotein subunit beta/FixA family protein [Bacillota bacterium]